MNNLLSTVLLALSFFSITNPVKASQIALVIDDLGYSYQSGKRAIELPGHITYAILPFAPRASDLAEYAKNRGKEIIIHLPMEAENEQQTKIEEITLLDNMSTIQYKIILDASLKRLNTAVGLSNHTGSLLTQKIGPMQALMSKLLEHNLYFLDSKTSSKSIAIEIANKLNVPNISRDFFLDNVKKDASMEEIFERAIKLSRKTGEALIIAHPYASSLGFLESKLKNLPEDVELVFASELATSYLKAPGPL